MPRSGPRTVPRATRAPLARLVEGSLLCEVGTGSQDPKQLELRVGRGTVADSEFKYWREGESSWGYVKLYAGNAVPEKVRTWIDLARNHASEDHGDDDDDPEE